MPSRRPSRIRAGAAASLALAALLLAGCGTTRPPADGAAAIAPERPAPPGAAGHAPSDAAPPQPAPPAADEPQAGENTAPDSPPPSGIETGLASWYGRAFHGRRTANGERFDMHALTAAHRTLPMPSFALVRNPANDRQVIVRINDRGPFKRGRIVDLSQAAAKLLGISGLAMVELRPLSIEEVGSTRPPAGGERLAREADPR